MNEELLKYIKENIFPIYNKNEKGHGIEHINYVIRRSLKFAYQFPDININIVYTSAAFHDIAHHIDKDNHETLSAQFFYEDEELKKYFTDEERIIIKEAIEDHRSSKKLEPRSIYGKILATADKNTSIEQPLRRTYTYSKRHFPEYTDEQIIDRAYEHISKKYGKQGYAKIYIDDPEYKKFINDINELLKNKKKFKSKYLKVNNQMK